MKPYIALLRAVNVGGTGKLPMKELREACEDIGFSRVSTYIASGNVVFESSKSAARVQAMLTDLLRDQFGLTKNDVIIREPEQLAQILDRNPFPDVVRDRPKLLHVSFLAGRPAADAAKALAAFKGPERMHLDGEHLYIDFPNGAGTSKLTPSFLERALGVKHTARNWNTVVKLLEMARNLSA